MRRLVSQIAVLLALAAPAVAWEFEEIGTIAGEFGGEAFQKPTVIVTDDDKVSPTAFMLLIGGGISSLSLMSGDGNFAIGATYMSHTPGPDTVPVSTELTYSTDGTMRFWLSEGAPEPLKVTFTTLTIDGEKGHVSGSFNGTLCFADGLGVEADPDNCRPIEGRFDTPFFVEQ